MDALPIKVITGIIVSCTTTVLTTSTALLPAPSNTLYVTVYEPDTKSFTLFCTIILLVKLPSLLSNAVAPSSVYSVFNSCNIDALQI